MTRRYMQTMLQRIDDPAWRWHRNASDCHGTRQRRRSVTVWSIHRRGWRAGERIGR